MCSQNHLSQYKVVNYGTRIKTIVFSAPIDGFQLIKVAIQLKISVKIITYMDNVQNATKDMT